MKTFLFFTILMFTIEAHCQLVCEWKKNLGGTNGDASSSITSTSDGGYIMGGSTSSPICLNQDPDVIQKGIIIKTDSEGNIEWSKCFDEYPYGINDVQQSDDGGYFMWTDNDKIVKVDAFGNIVWEYEDEGDYASYSTQWCGTVASGNEYIFPAWTLVSWPNDYAGTVTKLDATGNLIWQQTYEYQDDVFLNGVNILQTVDGGYVLCGLSGSLNDTTSNAMVMKIDPSGNLEWHRSYGGTGDDIFFDVVPSSSGGFFLAGMSSSNDGDVSGNHSPSNSTWYMDMWIIKIDDEGNLEWQRCIGGTDFEVIYSIEETESGGCIALGMTYSVDGDFTSNHGNADFALAELDDNGNIIWAQCMGGTAYDALSIYNPLTKSSDSGYVFAGGTNSIDGDIENPIGGLDIFLAKFSNTTSIDESLAQSFSIYPNPTNGIINLDFGSLTGINGYTLRIYNTLGQVVHTSSISRKNETIDLRTLGSSGNYKVVVTDREGKVMETKQIVVR